MKLEDAILDRRAQYPAQYSGGKIADHHIESMLKLANWAPTHKHTEPWRFRVYQDEAKDRLLDQLADTYVRITPSNKYVPTFKDKLMGRKPKVSHIIVISMKRHEKMLPEFEEIAAVAMAVQNMWLYAAQFKDIGAYWATPQIALSKEFGEQLELEEDEYCLGLFYMGTVDETAIPAQGERANWKEKIKWFKN